MAYDDIDKQIIIMLQGDIPLAPRPFAVLARRLDIDEQEVIQRIKRLKEDGIIRRYGAVLRHRKVGYVHNAMVAWNVNNDNADLHGEYFSSYKEVSHCYLRKTPPDFPYNLFTMIHCKSSDHLQELLHDMSAKTGIKDFLVIKSLKELKKTSMRYFE